MKAEFPANEASRIAALHNYNVLDTPAEPCFDDLVLLAAQLCQTPVAIVSFIDESRQWFKSKIGLNVTEFLRDDALCSHTLLVSDGIFEVYDARLDPRFADNPLVTGDSNIVFYAGVPLISQDNYALGTICVFDVKPKKLTLDQKIALHALGRQVMSLLEQRKKINQYKKTQSQRDVTSQKNAETQLQKLTELHRAIQESAGYAIISTTSKGVITSFNPAAERMLGYTAADVVGLKTPTLILEPSEVVIRAEEFSKELGKTIEPGFDVFVAKARLNLPNEYEWTYIRKDGSHFPVILSVTALRDEVGVINGFLGIAIDITERKKMERVLEQFKYTLDQTVDCVFICNSENFRFEYVNEGAKQQVGYTEAELLQMTVPEIKTQYSLEEYGVLVQPLLDGTEPSLTFETIHKHKSGQEIPVEVTMQLVCQEDEKPRLVAVVRDMSDRKRVEKLLRSKNEELKSFAYTVSHDLKAPLRGISGYAQEIERRHQEGLPERAQFCIKQIITAAHNLDRLIEDLLIYSRVDSETPTPTEIDLCVLVKGIMRDRSLVIAEQGVEIIIDIPAIRLKIWERGLHQVLTNLIDNAIKYSRNAKPPRLNISAKQTDTHCIIVVKDNGVGFNMKYHDRIFGLFNRLVRADEFEGTGAGLAIVAKLLKKLNGKIYAESKVDHGATFFVELPISVLRKSKS